MLAARTIRGKRAVVKWSYYNAGAVVDYAATHDKTTGWRVTASFVPGLVDAYKMAQRPLYFVAPFKNGAWRWEIKTLDRFPDGRFLATLGPLIEEKGNQHGIAHPAP